MFILAAFANQPTEDMGAAQKTVEATKVAGSEKYIARIPRR